MYHRPLVEQVLPLVPVDLEADGVALHQAEVGRCRGDGVKELAPERLPLERPGGQRVVLGLGEGPGRRGETKGYLGDMETWLFFSQKINVK